MTISIVNERDRIKTIDRRSGETGFSTSRSKAKYVFSAR